MTLPVGRPTDLTDELERRICETLKAAGTVEDACSHHGIDTKTFYNWQRKGREGDPRYVQFFRAVQKARDDRRIATEAQIRAHGKKNWQALAWLLERTEPKRYAMQVRLHVGQELGDAVDRIKAAFADKPAELEIALLAIAGEYSGDRAGENEGDSSDEDARNGQALLPASAELQTTPIPGE
jgi:hypothetical protein